MTKKIFCSMLLVCMMVLISAITGVMGVLYHYFSENIHDNLQSEAMYLAVAVENEGIEYLNRITNQTERITLIDEDGTVLYDNMADITLMENHADRIEFKEAMENGVGESTRYSGTMSERTIYYAVKLGNNQVLRVANTHYTVFTLLGGLIFPIVLILAGMLVLSAVISSRVSRKIVEPMNQLDLEHPDQGEVYDELVPFVTKISRQKRTINRQLTDAKKQQEEFSVITENMQEGFLVIDSETEVLSFNKSALKLLHADYFAPKQSVLTLNHSKEFCEVVETVLAGNHTETVLELGQKRCQLIANPVWEKDNVKGAIFVLIDVTEKMDRENLRREFTANVSHELKTPLTSISGYAEIIQNGFVRPEDTGKFAGKIFEESQRLITLVNDIIRISQLDEGLMPYEKEEIDLYEAVKETMEHLEAAAKQRGISVKLAGTHEKIYSVRTILHEVLYNLCDNAIKYNKENGLVKVTVRKDGDAICVTVKDTGIGIPQEDQERVFERFYRVDKSHSKEIGGTGLGLSIVKHGAASMGAVISMESVLGEGTAITLTFPKERDEA